MQFEIKRRSERHGRLIVKCERGHEGVCQFSLSTVAPVPEHIWLWDGKLDSGTITPSILCRGGCNRHFNITAGIATGIL